MEWNLWKVDSAFTAICSDPSWWNIVLCLQSEQMVAAVRWSYHCGSLRVFQVINKVGGLNAEVTQVSVISTLWSLVLLHSTSSLYWTGDTGCVIVSEGCRQTSQGPQSSPSPPGMIKVIAPSSLHTNVHILYTLHTHTGSLIYTHHWSMTLSVLSGRWRSSGWAASCKDRGWNLANAKLPKTRLLYRP